MDRASVRRAWARRILACGIGLLCALASGEALARGLDLRPTRPGFWIGDAAGRPLDAAAESSRQLVMVVPQTRWPALTFAPGARFTICYPGERGCIDIRINAFGIRERDDLTIEKVARERRIVCLGDSLTFCWGVRAEDGWPRLVEAELARESGPVRTINCGFAGTGLLDECATGLAQRFLRFRPDDVVVTICLNDLVVLLPDGLLATRAPIEIALRRWSRLVEFLCASHDASHLYDVEPGIDAGARLLSRSCADPVFALPGHQWERFWAGGGPQQALREMRDLCAARGIRFVAVLWPAMQGLDSGAWYPFTSLHELVRAFCEAERIPLLDLLSAFRGRSTADLRVARGDAHPNERAQRIAAPLIASLLARVERLAWR